MDKRDYGVGAQMLRHLGITKLKLMSNNPKKRAALLGYGIEISGYLFRSKLFLIRIMKNKYSQTKVINWGMKFLRIKLPK